MYRYAEDESTDLLCVCWAFDDGPVHAWIPSADDIFCHDVKDVDGSLYAGPLMPSLLRATIQNRGEVHCWNAAFERAVLKGPAGQRYGFPRLEIKQMRCSMARSRYCSLPGRLEDAANELNTPVKKRVDGLNAMRYLCKPRKDGSRPTIVDERERFLELVPYCADDVRAERCVDALLPELSPKEQQIWELDQAINDRGVLVDLKALDNLEAIIAAYKDYLEAECLKTTGVKPTQRAQLANWIREHGWPNLTDLQAETVGHLLENAAVPDDVKRILSIYATHGIKAVAKFPAIRNAVCKDGRIRGMLMYHGAGTGRWSSVIVQIHNLFRPVIDDAESAIEACRARSLDWIRALYPGIDPMKVISSCVRGVFIAKEGHELVFPDFSGIEARFNAWLFNEEWKLDAYRAYDRGEGPDLYRVAYGRAFGVDPAAVTKPQRFIGKVLELAMGYGGGVGAFAKMAKSNKLDLGALIPVWATLPPGLRAEAERHFDDPIYKAKATGLAPEIWKVCEALKLAWREAHPKITQGWRDLENSALNAVANPGVEYTVARGRVSFKTSGEFLVMTLPSGRDVRYYKPRFDDEGKLLYRGVDTETRQYGATDTYGGKLCENVVQAGCRDLLAGAMLRFDKLSWKVNFHVHDEPVLEVPIGKLTDAEVKRIMCTAPKWAEGFPLNIDGHRGKRYRK